MLESAVPIVFWIFLPISLLVKVVCLTGIYRKNFQLTDARWHLDEGHDEGLGYEIYKLTLASDRLVAFAHLVAVAVIASALYGMMVDGIDKIFSFVFLGILAHAVEHIRERHSDLESVFQVQVGESLACFSRRSRAEASPA